MNKDWRNIINKILGSAIPKAYRKGIKSVIDNQTVMKFADEPNPLYDIDWTGTDRKTVERFKQEAFWVAGVGSYELEEKLKEIGVKVVEGEIKDFGEFEIEARRIMLEYGIGLGEQPPTGWLKTNLDTAITSAINGARWNRLHEDELIEIYPALMYKTQRDKRVRPEHQLLDGKIFLSTDEVWKKIYPPNGWNCRCYVEPIAKGSAELKDLEKPGKEDKEKYYNEVDKDFQHNSGMVQSIWGRWLKTKLKDLPGNVKEEILGTGR